MIKVSIFLYYEIRITKTDQASRQLKAANGVKIQWYFNDEISLNAVEALFHDKVLEGIEFILKPMK